MPSNKFKYDRNGEQITSGGVRLSDVPDHAKHEVEWMDGLHGSAQDDLPSEAEGPFLQCCFPCQGCTLSY